MPTDPLAVAIADAPPRSSKTPRVAIITLGCGRNEVDSDQLAGLLAAGGQTVVDDPQRADVVVVNTCTFIEPAKQESIDTVLAACQLKDDGDARAVLVVGCMAQRYPQELADAIPEADAIVGFDGYAQLPGLIDAALRGPLPDRVVGVGAPDPGARPAGRSLPLLPVTARAAPAAAASDADLVLGLRIDELPPEAPRVDGRRGTDQDALDRVPATGPRFPVRAHDGRPWAYLKIASGCDRLCTFCAIPSFRGRFRSRPLDELLAEAAWLAANGARELVLVSENTTSWGKDLSGGRAGQPTLLRELAAVDGIERLRLMYLQPAELTGALLDAIAGEPTVASYFDLSLQHVSGPVLARMARSGDPERFGRLIDRIRTADPGAVLRSNFIVGFPGETEQDVQALERFLEEQRLDWVGLFPFSREDGTPSDTLPDQVPATATAERLARLTELQERVADDAARAFVGRHLDVLVDGTDDDEVEGLRTVGRSYREAPDTDGDVTLLGPGGTAAEIPAGRMVRARVLESVGVDLRAQVVSSGGERRGG